MIAKAIGPKVPKFSANADCVMIDDDIMNVRGAVENGMIGILHTAFERTAVEIQSLFDIEGEF